MKDTFNIFQIYKSKNHRYCFVVRPNPSSRLLSLCSSRQSLVKRRDERRIKEKIFVARDVVLVNFKKSVCLTININGIVVKQSEEVLKIFDDRFLTIEAVSPFKVSRGKASQVSTQ